MWSECDVCVCVFCVWRLFRWVCLIVYDYYMCVCGGCLFCMCVCVGVCLCVRCVCVCVCGCLCVV